MDEERTPLTRDLAYEAHEHLGKHLPTWVATDGEQWVVIVPDPDIGGADIWLWTVEDIAYYTSGEEEGASR